MKYELFNYKYVVFIQSFSKNIKRIPFYSMQF